jgi:hypothetical protein
MPHVSAARMASRERDAGRYQRHRPEQTLLYQIVDEYYPAFAALMAEQGKELPGYVQREFEKFLKCGRLDHGFAGALRVLPRRASGCLQLQTSRFLPLLGRATHGRECGAVGR